MSFERRRLRHPRDIRALSHPLRLRLLDLLDEGPLTATEAAAAAGATPANCSFHLRLLARHGFVTEAPGGSGRQRPWKLAEQDISLENDDLDEPARSAVRALIGVMDERRRQRVGQWRRTREEFPAEWREAASEAFMVAHLTAAELTELTAALHEVLRPYLRSGPGERSPGSVPIDIYLAALPRRQPEELL